MVNEEGYTKLWYTKTSIRWLGAAFDIVALCLFGSTWAEEYDSIGEGYMGIWWLVVLAPLISLLVNLSALVTLFLVRKNMHINPAWVLASDVFAGTVLAATTGLFYGAADRLPGYLHGGGVVQLRVVWDLSLCALILEFFAFLGGVRDVHLHRRDMRARRLAEREKGKVEGVGADDCEDIALGALPSAPSPHDPTRPELASRILVELPDGQILELPEGSRVELPSEATRAELPSRRSVSKLETRDLHVVVSPVELESPSSVAQSFQRSPATAWSF